MEKIINFNQFAERAKSVENLYWLDKIQPSDRDTVGEKAFFSSSLMQKNHPVVPGFVVPAKTFWQFLESIDWLEPLFADLPNSSLYLNVDEPRQLQAIARSIRSQIAAAKLPDSLLFSLESAVSELNSKALIFRPALTSRTPNTAGMLEAQAAWSTAEGIAGGIKRAWAQLFKAQSLFYWQRCGMKIQQIQPAVLVQPLQRSIAAGSLQTLNPETMEIQATCGLGMSIDRGESIPDYYQVQPETGGVKIQRLGCKTLAYNLKLLNKNKVKIAIGSDHANTPVDEVKALQKLKIFDNLTILKLWCEVSPQAIFPNRKLGLLKHGYEASFLALDENPLTDLSNLSKISLRIKQGHVIKVK